MGYKQGLRPFIGLDGTFLKRKAKGQILVVVGQDNMNQFYHIAWAVVDKETKRSRTWFMELLKNSLELNMGEGVTSCQICRRDYLRPLKQSFQMQSRDIVLDMLRQTGSLIIEGWN